jgi:hypothetical protein
MANVKWKKFFKNVEILPKIRTYSNDKDPLTYHKAIRAFKFNSIFYMHYHSYCVGYLYTVHTTLFMWENPKGPTLR